MQIEETQNFEKIREIIEDIRVAMLVTADEEVRLNSRPMYTADIDSENNIWFFTHDDSGKVKQMIDDHHINLSYANPEDGSYLSVSGTASFNDSLKRKEDLFNLMTKAWFPEGAEDPDLLLIKVKPDSAEYWETSSSKLVQLYRVVKAVTTDQVYQGGKHGKVSQM